MFEIAGLMISGVSLVTDLFSTHRDLASWDEADLLVDSNWLSLALRKGHLAGSEADYSWSAEAKVPTREMQGTHAVVLAHNDEKKIKHRIVRGAPQDRLVLMKRLSTSVGN